jgi:hypothetical protein
VTTRTLRRAARPLDRHPTLTLWLSAAIALAISLLLAALLGIPRPLSHDEFSYLLESDTFAEGRLANPPLALPDAFETMHVIQRPTYVSRYQPGQSAFLALGQVLGNPILGVWLGMALMAASLCWMLRAWMPARWALLGSTIASLGLASATAWGQGYWGAQIPTLASALVIGATARLARAPRITDALILGAGTALLANTRMYEGGILCLCCGGYLAIRILRTHGLAVLIRRVLLPAALILLPTFAFDAYFNYRTTGSLTHNPYALYIQRYQTAPIFVWQHPKPNPGYASAAMEKFHLGYEMHFYPQPFGPRELAKLEAGKVRVLAHFYIKSLLWGPPLLALLLLPWLWRNRPTRLAIFAAAAILAAHAATVFYLPHYSSPGAPLFLLLVLQALRIAAARRNRRWITIALLAIGALAWTGNVAAQYRRRPHIPLDAPSPDRLPRLWDEPGAKPEVSSWLLRHSGPKILVLVRYGAKHDVNAEWVYNGADLAHQPIIWARSLTPEQDADLLRHYSDRAAWYFDVGTPDGIPRLTSLPPAQTPQTPTPPPASLRNPATGPG